MKIDLHIGLTKTGTSQFQHLLSRSASHLKEQGILYPKSGRKFNAHHGLVKLLIEQRVDTVSKPTTTMDELLNEIDKAKKQGLERVIISSEALMVIRGPEKGIERLKAEHDVSAYAFLRPPISWTNSMLNQTYKNVLYERKHIDESLSQHDRAKRSITIGMNFHERLAAWEEILGLDSVRVTCLEKGDNYLEKITEALNVALPPIKTDNKIDNTSLCGESLQYLAWLADSERSYSHDEKVRFMNILNDYSKGSNFKPKNYIPVELQALAIERAAEITRIIGQKYFDGKVVLSEAPPFDDYFDFKDYDQETVLKVNRYVLKRLDSRMEQLRFGAKAKTKSVLNFLGVKK